MATRRPRWHPPPPPAPKILHLPRRRRRPRTTTAASAKPTFPKPTTKSPTLQRTMPAGRLESLFERERPLTSDRRRTRLEDDYDHGPSSSTQSVSGNVSGGETEGEKWRLQVEILRAECNFLRLESVVAHKKEAAFRSAVDSLVSERRKIDGSGNAVVVMKELEGKLEGLRIGRRRFSGGARKETEVGWSNFDKKALLLRRRLQEMNVREMMPKKKKDEDEEEEVCVRKIKEVQVDPDTNSIQEGNSRLSEVETMRRKMECLSKAMLEKMQVYGTILSSTTTCTCAAGNGSSINRSTRNEAPNSSQAAAEKASADQIQRRECFGRCRAVLGRIVEEVKAETEQWGEMQGMVEQVKEEMDELRCSRDFWERSAVQSDQKLRTTNSQVMEWRQRARASEQRASKLRRQVTELQSEVEELKDELRQRSHCDMQKTEKEKSVVSCRSVGGEPRRRPLREICNLSTVKSARRLEA